MPYNSTRPCPQCGEPFAPRRREQVCCSRPCACEARKAESAARFWARVGRSDEDACWLWAGKLAHKGHGVTWWYGRNEQAHRVAWMLLRGPIPKGRCVLHNCPGGDNPACVNVRHLWLGDKAANNHDRDAKGRTCRGDRNWQRLFPERVRRGEAVGLARLTADKVRAIRRERAGGLSYDELATRYAIGKTTIANVVLRRTWKHVP